jgi:hypothetical protein
LIACGGMHFLSLARRLHRVTGSVPSLAFGSVRP